MVCTEHPASIPAGLLSFVAHIAFEVIIDRRPKEHGVRETMYMCSKPVKPQDIFWWSADYRVCILSSEDGINQQLDFRWGDLCLSSHIQNVCDVLKA